MNEHIEKIKNYCIFSEQDAKEVFELIIKNERVTDVDSFDFVRAYEDFGARWDDKELYEYYNEGWNKDEYITVEELLGDSSPIFTRLTSGLIISWKY